MATGVLVLGGCGASGVKAKVPLGMAASQVQEILGEPDSKSLDREDWAWIIEPPERCPKELIAQSWFYDYTFDDDAVIFFGNDQRVVCVHEGGSFTPFRGAS